MKKYTAPTLRVHRLVPCQLLCESQLGISTQSVSEANIIEMETKSDISFESDDIWDEEW